MTASSIVLNAGPVPSSIGSAMGAAAFTLNGAIASASFALAGAYLKEGNYSEAIASSLAGISAQADMVAVGASFAPGVTTIEAKAVTVGLIASLAAMVASQGREVAEKLPGWLDAAGQAYDKALDDFSDWFLPKVFGLSDTLRDWFGLNRDGTYYIYDPLVLDLDGDGIETIGHNKYYGAMFDLNANGIKNATGWVKGDVSRSQFI